MTPETLLRTTANAIWKQGLSIAGVDVHRMLEAADEVATLLARLERVNEFREKVAMLVNDGEPHEMGGPFIDGNWLLSGLDAHLAPSDTLQASPDTSQQEELKWWQMMSEGDIAAELSGTFDIGLLAARGIARWMLAPDDSGGADAHQVAGGTDEP